MGNQQSGGPRRGPRINEAISNTLAAISEHTLDWKDDEDDSIWDEASLAEDVLSLGESSGSFAEEVDAVELLPTIIPLTKKIEATKYRLLKAQSKTLEKRRDIKVEQKNYRSELKKTEKLLKKVAKQATAYFSYFDYFNMVKRSYNVKKDENLDTTYTKYYPNTQRSAAYSPARNKSMSTAIVTQANSFYFSVFALWEAYLLKKAHVAVMQNNQQKVQKKGWNKVILHLTNEKDGIVEAFEDEEFELRGNIKALQDKLTALRNAYTDLARCQEKLISKLQEHENWRSESPLNAYTTEEEDSSESDEESEDSIPREISTRTSHQHDSVSDFAGSSARNGWEKQVVDARQHEDEEVDLNDGRTKIGDQHEDEEVDLNDMNDNPIEKNEEEEVDINKMEGKAAEEEAVTESTSEGETQERESSEHTGEKTISADSAVQGEADTDPESMEVGMSSGSLLLEENNKESMLSPLELRNEGLRDKMKNLKKNLRTSMRDLSLEEDDIW